MNASGGKRWQLENKCPAVGGMPRPVAFSVPPVA